MRLTGSFCVETNNNVVSINPNAATREHNGNGTVIAE
jgi:hypothetical protein